MTSILDEIKNNTTKEYDSLMNKVRTYSESVKESGPTNDDEGGSEQEPSQGDEGGRCNDDKSCNNNQLKCSTTGTDMGGVKICMNRFDADFKGKSWDWNTVKDKKINIKDNSNAYTPQMCKQVCTDNNKCSAWMFGDPENQGSNKCYNFQNLFTDPTHQGNDNWYAGINSDDPRNVKCELNPKSGTCQYPGYSDECQGYGKTKKGKNITISTCACDKDNCYNDFCWNFVSKLKKQVKDTKPYKNKPGKLCEDVLNNCRKSINLCKNFTDPINKLKCRNISQAYAGLEVRYNNNNTITTDGSGDCLYGEGADGKCNTGVAALNNLNTSIGSDAAKSKDVINALLCNIATSVHNVPKEQGCRSNGGKLDVSDWFYTNIFGVSSENSEGTSTSKGLFYGSRTIYWLFFGFFILNIAGAFNKVFNYNTSATLYTRKKSLKFIIIFILLIGVLGFGPFIYGIVKSNDDIITDLNTKSTNKDVQNNINNYEENNLNSNDPNNKISQSEYLKKVLLDRLQTGLIIYGGIVGFLYLVFAGLPKNISFIGSIILGIIVGNSTSIVAGISTTIGIFIGSWGLEYLGIKLGAFGIYKKIFNTVFSPLTFIMAFSLISVFVAFNYIGGYFGTFMPAIMIILTIIQKIFDTPWGNTKDAMSGNTSVTSYVIGNILIKTIILILSWVGLSYVNNEKFLNSEFIRYFLTVALVIIIIQYIFVVIKTITSFMSDVNNNNPYFLSNYLVRGWLPFGMSAFYYIVELLMKGTICGNPANCGQYEGLFNFFSGINTDN